MGWLLPGDNLTLDSLALNGLTGATAGIRYVGGTTSGPPITGTFAVGDVVVAENGGIYICITAGTPGTWKLVGLRPNTGDPLTLEDDDGDSRIVIETNGDITVYKDDGSTVALLWDQSDDRWEFLANVQASSPFVLLGTDAANEGVTLRHDGTNQSGFFGQLTALSDEFYMQSGRGGIRIRAIDAEGGAGANISLWADDSGGVIRLRQLVSGASGDIGFYRVDGSTVSLLWDESDGRWEFTTPVLVGTDIISTNEMYLKVRGNGVAGQLRLYVSDTGLTDRIRLYMPGASGDIFWRKLDGATVSLQWDQSDDRWEVVSGDFRVDTRLDINNGIALGGGASATLGTIGGTGPTAAAQAQWVEIDVGGVAHWIPVWT